jgi:hypothetical protein
MAGKAKSATTHVIDAQSMPITIPTVASRPNSPAPEIVCITAPASIFPLAGASRLWLNDGINKTFLNRIYRIFYI